MKTKGVFVFPKTIICLLCVTVAGAAIRGGIIPTRVVASRCACDVLEPSTTTRGTPFPPATSSKKCERRQPDYDCLSRTTTTSTTSTKIIGLLISNSQTLAIRQPIVSSLLDIRGGVLYDDDDDDDDDNNNNDSDDDDDETLFNFDDDNDHAAGGMTEREFCQDNTLDRMWDAWKKTPPLTKVFLQASAFTTFYGYLFNKNQFPKIFTLDWKQAITRLQIWRLITSFLNFGPLGLGYLMTAHFVWTYMSTLERLSYNKPYDFWIMILFGQIAMVIGYPLLKLSPRFLGHNLSTYLVYIWSRYHEGMEVNLFELFNTRAEMLPWFFLAQTFLLEGEPPVLDFLGIAFGHVYHHCKTVGLLTAPQSLVQWYQNGQSKLATQIRQEYRKISTDFEMI